MRKLLKVLLLCVVSMFSSMILFCTTAEAKEIMVLVPHEDDEVLIAAGVIRSGIQNGDTVKVVLVTNGDYEGLAATRIQESVNALTYLGVHKDNIYFLGYGDTGSEYDISFIYRLFYAESDTQILASRIGTSTYGNSSINVNDYHYQKYGVHGDYNRSNILNDIQSVINENLPDDIYTTSLYDYHGDHVGTYLFANEAIRNIKKNNPNYAPVVHQAVVHAKGGADDSTWPVRDSLTEVPSAFTEPGDLSTYSLLDWDSAERIPVPASMLTVSRADNEKYNAISMYASQTAAADAYLHAFTKSNEVFWRKDYSNIALLANVSVSSENASSKQQGVKAIDGIADGYPRFTQHEWATIGEMAGAWIKLSWPEIYSVNRIVLYDRPNQNDQIKSATIKFSDGTSINVDAFPNNGTEKIISFPTKQVTWIKLVVEDATGENIGLTEFEVYGNLATEAIVGNRTNGATIDVCDADLTFTKIYVPQTIDATSVKLNIANPSQKVKCAIYSDTAGDPGTLLGESSEVSNPETGWLDLTLSNSIRLESETYYWIAIWGNAGLKVRADTAGEGLYTPNYSYGQWPSSPVGLTTNSFAHCVYVKGTLCGTKYEGEEATLSGTAYVDTYGAGYSGTGYVGGLDLALGNSLTFQVNANATTTYQVDFRYANATGMAQTLSLYVNGVHVKDITFPDTGEWGYTWATLKNSISLSAGINNIKLQLDAGDGATDIDYIRVY